MPRTLDNQAAPALDGRGDAPAGMTKARASGMTKVRASGTTKACHRHDGQAGAA